MRDSSHGQARQYARALFQVSAGQSPDGALRLQRELRELVALIERHPELRAALGGVGVTLQARGRTLAAVVERAGGSDLLQRLASLLAEHNHLPLLPQTAASFGEMVNAARGIVAAEATSAVPLGQEQEHALAQALRQVSGGQIELASRVDSRVLGGLRVKMEGRTYDGTVRARLEALRRSLASGR